MARAQTAQEERTEASRGKAAAENRTTKRKLEDAPVAPPSTINSTALMYEESSEARKSTAFASSSGSPHRLGKLDIVFANAGIGGRTPTGATDEAVFENVPGLQTTKQGDRSPVDVSPPMPKLLNMMRRLRSVPTYCNPIEVVLYMELQ
jgi:hypothetical protein